jgi:hypothetical protein
VIPESRVAHEAEEPEAWPFAEERVTGIEPAFSAWEADVLPLNYTRKVDEDTALRR